MGVCGKTPEVASLQDLLTYSLKSIACWASFAAGHGVAVPTQVYSFLHLASFSTLTNVNFDDARFKVSCRVEKPPLASFRRPGLIVLVTDILALF